MHTRHPEKIHICAQRAREREKDRSALNQPVPRQVMNHWVVLEQCGPDTQLTIVAILDMGGAIPPSLISVAIGEMGSFYTNLQTYVHAFHSDH